MVGTADIRSHWTNHETSRPESERLVSSNPRASPRIDGRLRLFPPGLATNPESTLIHKTKELKQAQFPECSVVHRTCQSPSVTFGKQFIFQDEVFGLRMQEALLKGELPLKGSARSHPLPAG